MFKQQKSSQILLTLSTCFYVLKSKFPPEKYVKWMSNLLSLVDNFNLVIYTDQRSFDYIKDILDIKHYHVRIVLKSLEDFNLYKYKNEWIRNHCDSNLRLHHHISWELNMLWNEKIFFVRDTINKGYFKTIYYGWCDIGYFRNYPNNIHTELLNNWPNPKKLLNMPFLSNYIHYTRVQKDNDIYINELESVNNHYLNNLPSHPCSDLSKNFFAGGFFILKSGMINIYSKLYEEKLKYYFEKKYIIKDDQTILLDIIATNSQLFYIHENFATNIDEWFMFQLVLS
jgi:hypothetical protein